MIRDLVHRYFVLLGMSFENPTGCEGAAGFVSCVTFLAVITGLSLLIGVWALPVTVAAMLAVFACVPGRR